MNLTRVIFQVHYNGAYPLEINEPPIAIDFCIILFSWGFVIYVEIEVGIDGVSASQVPEHVPRIGVKNGQYILIVSSSECLGEAEIH